MTTRLRYLPDYSTSNPYQRMLYRRCAAHDIEVRPIAVRELAELAAAPQGDLTVVHVHWTNPIVQRYSDPLDARRSMRTFLHEVDRLRGEGAVLLWTIHNVLPHDHRHHLLELELHRALAERADLVHVLTARTIDATRHDYRLDESRVVHVAHSTFEGEYPAAMPRAQARQQLGLRDDDDVIVMAGALRPYRGAARLLDALELLAADGQRPRLLLGGRSIGDDSMLSVLDRARRLPHVTLVDDGLDEAGLALWMSAADIAAMPYESILNSGSFGLALTYGLPIVAPAEGALLDDADEPFVHLYPPRDTSALAEALRSALRRDTLESRRLAARTAAVHRSPDRMARDFASGLTSRLRSLTGRPLD